jgi:hypothetical protein
MVSGFVCQCHGFMKAVIDGVEKKSYQIFHAGTNRDGWFKSPELDAQLKDCAKLFRHFHPEAKLWISFDNSLNRRA